MVPNRLPAVAIDLFFANQGSWQRDCVATPRDFRYAPALLKLENLTNPPQNL